MAPTNVRVSGTPTANSITVTWNVTAGTSEWEVFAVVDGEGTAPDNAAPSGTVGILASTAGGNPPLIYPGLRSDTNYRFYVRAVCGNGRKSDWVPAAALIRTLESCKFPNTPTVVANSISRTSANFSWNQAALNGVTPTSWQVVVQPVTGIAPPYVVNAPILTSNTNVSSTLAIPGTLQSGTRYEYYVRAYCGPNNVSRWIGPVVFTTLCDPLTVPYSQGFNTTSDRVFCWSVLNNGGANAWALNYNVTPFEGDQSASIVPNNGTTNDDWLISPTLTLQANYRLRFKYKVQSATLANKIEIKLSTTGNSPVTAADFTETLMVPTTWNNTQYVEKIIYFSPASAGQQINVGWHLPLGEDNRNRIYIDDVV
ncbi:MAG: fibronectin type III domain-containing protein, partial [Pedobacter sp.]